MGKHVRKRRKPAKNKAQKEADMESFFWVIVVGFLLLALFAYLYIEKRM